MKTKLIATLLIITSISVFATEQETKKENDKPLIVNSSKGKVEIKSKTKCQQIKNPDNTISVVC